MARDLIVDDRARRLVALVLASGPSQTNSALRALVDHLTARCARPAVQAAVARAHVPTPYAAGRYPVRDGFALGFNALHQEAKLRAAWRAHGVVVGAHVVSVAQRQAVLAAVDRLFAALSQGQCRPDDSSTHGYIPHDPDGRPLLSRGFLELYHDAALANVRQSLPLYLHHVVLWGRADLWTSFDRVGLKPPGGANGGALPPHVDQNPHREPGFRTLQGVLALHDIAAGQGAFHAVPGSRALFPHLAAHAAPTGDHVNLPPDAPLAVRLFPRLQAFPLRAGDVVTWDSRTLHTGGANLSPNTRTVVYVAAGPAPTGTAVQEARAESRTSGRGWNNRAALMHATQKPRFLDLPATAGLRAPDQLTWLGERLYGVVPWDRPFGEAPHG